MITRSDRHTAEASNQPCKPQQTISRRLSTAFLATQSGRAVLPGRKGSVRVSRASLNLMPCYFPRLEAALGASRAHHEQPGGRCLDLRFQEAPKDVGCLSAEA